MMKKIIKSFFVILIISIITKLASFISEIIIASLLGTSHKADAYSIIIGLHQVFYPMLSIGIWSLFLPMYKKKTVSSSRKEAIEFLNKILSFFIIISIVFIIIVNIFSINIINIIANGFSDELKTTCSILLKIYSPYFLFVIISSIFAAVLQSEDNFFASQIREIVTYLPTIILGPIAYSMYDVYGLIAVLVLGGILRLLILLPFLKDTSKLKISFKYKDKDFKEFLIKMPSVLITSSIEHINTLIDKSIASTLLVGSVSSLSYGSKLVNVFNGLFSTALTTSLYPTMSQLVAENKSNEIKRIINNTIIIMSIIIIPISLLMILLKKEIVTFVFARGEFSSQSVDVTSLSFMGYLIGMFFIGVKPFVNNVFYSYGETKTTMRISICVIIINITLDIILSSIYGVVGLSLATSISCIIYFLLSLLMMRKLIKYDIKYLFISLLKIYVISFVSYFICYFIYINCTYFINNYFLNSIIISVIYFFIYIILLLLLGFKETKEICLILFNKIKGVKNGN